MFAQVYLKWQLLGSAITQLEAISELENRAELSQQLGDLYFQVSFFSRADRSYQTALTAAKLANNLTAQAEAWLGWGESPMFMAKSKQRKVIFRLLKRSIKSRAI